MKKGNYKKVVDWTKAHYLELIILLIIIHGLFNTLFLIDYTTVFLVLILVLSPYFSLIKKIKIGEFEAEISGKEIKVIEEKSDNLIFKEGNQIKNDKMFEDLHALAENDIKLALAKVRMEIEDRIKFLEEVYLKEGFKKTGLKRAIEMLIRKNVIDSSLGALLNDVVTVANRAIHGEYVSEENAFKIIDLAIKVMSELDYVMLNKVFKSTKTDLITTKELEGYQNDNYLLKTIIPYANNPEIRTYNVNQAELSAFLEGLENVAEFLISLERVNNK
ncbi:MAG: hypothetical protein WC472_02725 [Candidatus Paceibacterota bacterium]